MPRRNAAAALAAVAALGLATGCERQSPYVTVTAHGVVVKARATKFCHDDGTCIESTDTPNIAVRNGDTLGIDVPSEIAKDGWRIVGQEEFSHDNYRSLPIGQQLQPGADIQLQIERDSRHGAGEWHFTITVK